MDLARFYSMCLQGDVRNAIEHLESSENKSAEDCLLLKEYKNRFLKPFTTGEYSEDPWINDVLNGYCHYFHSVLTDEQPEKAEKLLISSLSRLPGVSRASGMDEIESDLESLFIERGYSFLGGVTAPFRGPYIWKTTRKKDYDVLLPCGIQHMTIFFLSDFLMLSWAHYATFGKYYAGGWAKTEGLYCVNADNRETDTGSAEFQVSFLKHEAQHLYDYGRYPNLDGANLEYRAKLVELIYYPDALRLIEKFIAESKNDRSLPHPFAAFSIMENLSSSLFCDGFVTDPEKWRNTDPSRISDEALRLFHHNENGLKALGNATKGVI